MEVSLAQLNSKIAIDGIDNAIKGLQQFTQAFDLAAAGASNAIMPVDDIVAALAKFSIIKEAVGSLISLGQQTIQNYSTSDSNVSLDILYDATRHRSSSNNEILRTASGEVASDEVAIGVLLCGAAIATGRGYI